MKKFIILFVILAGVIVALKFFGFLYPLNNLVPQSPDISCKMDSDCTLTISRLLNPCGKSHDCTMYNVSDSEVTVVNKGWKPFCPFGEPSEKGVAYIMCIGGISGSDASNTKCIENKCQKVLTP